MSTISDVILFVVTTVIVMLLIQSYRFAIFIKQTEGKDYWTVVTMTVLIFNPSTETMSIFKYYAGLLGGGYLSAYKRGYFAEKELGNTPDEISEERVNVLERELYFIREFFYPKIAVLFLTSAKNTSEFRYAVKMFLREISSTNQIDDKHGFIAGIEEQIQEFAEEEDMTRDEVLGMLGSYLLNMDEKFIKRKIKECRQ